ncbi:MAG: tRNA (adenosine(37)-N6)-threonylcarbamoyltransferase complex dimerization subunit type 1 TsaB [Magnetococcus sp. DMHC-1]|nr:tRNA (adenosine(37)-N6)-threonylcarbamoyltransferase complex dimerization subunit type 1 TsaB [Magnetococcales bacterium]
MKILAMDTSDREGSAALLEDESLIVRRCFQGPEGHMLHLPKAVAEILAAASWTPASLDLLVVTLGPGAFTGLRIALGFAKGLAMAGQIPLKGISTLELLKNGLGGSGAPAFMAAFSPQTHVSPILVAMDARRGDVFAALYHTDGRCLWPPGRWTPEQLTARIAQVPEGVRVVWEGDRDAVILGRLGLHRFNVEGTDDPLTLEPLYLRRADAEQAAQAEPVGA